MQTYSVILICWNVSNVDLCRSVYLRPIRWSSTHDGSLIEKLVGRVSRVYALFMVETNVNGEQICTPSLIMKRNTIANCMLILAYRQQVLDIWWNILKNGAHYPRYYAGQPLVHLVPFSGDLTLTMIMAYENIRSGNGLAFAQLDQNGQHDVFVSQRCHWNVVFNFLFDKSKISHFSIRSLLPRRLYIRREFPFGQNVF